MKMHFEFTIQPLLFKKKKHKMEKNLNNKTENTLRKEFLYISNNCCQVVSMRDSLWLCKTFSLHYVVSLALLLYHLKTEQGARGSDYTELKRYWELNKFFCVKFSDKTACVKSEDFTLGI